MSEETTSPIERQIVALAEGARPELRKIIELMQELEKHRRILQSINDSVGELCSGTTPEMHERLLDLYMDTSCRGLREDAKIVLARGGK